jgi:hypothetical protein
MLPIFNIHDNVVMRFCCGLWFVVCGLWFVVCCGFVVVCCLGFSSGEASNIHG